MSDSHTLRLVFLIGIGHMDKTFISLRVMTFPRLNARVLVHPFPSLEHLDVIFVGRRAQPKGPDALCFSETVIKHSLV